MFRKSLISYLSVTVGNIILLFCSFKSFADKSPPKSSDENQNEESFDFEDWSSSIDDDDMYESEVLGYRLHSTDQVTGFAETVEVSEHQKSITDVSEVISRSAGVQVKTMGGLGSYSAASVRGSTPNQVPIFLDGVLLNVGGYSNVNLGDFSLNTLRSIEIYRGNAPLAVGTSGIGGAVVLNTRVLDKPLLEYAAGYGSWNTWRLSTLYGTRVGKSDILAVVTGQHSDGDFLYFNRNGTLYNPDDDKFVNRTNNNHTAFSSLLKIRKKLGDLDLSLMDDFFHKRSGISGIDHMVDKSDAKLDVLRNTLSTCLETKLSDKSAFNLNLSHLYLFESYYDMSGHIGIGHQDNEYITNGATATAVLKNDFSKKHITTFRLSSRYENYKERRLNLEADDQQKPSHRVKTEIGTEHEWVPVSRLHIVSTLRGEIHYSHFGGGSLPSLLTDFPETSKNDFFFSPSLGARLEITEGLTLRVNGGRYTRTPDLNELFGDHGSVVGNPELDPEVGYNVDAGTTYFYAGSRYLNLFRIDAAWFASWVSDLISLEQNSQNTARPVNVEAAMIQGTELSLRLSLFKLITLSGNYTYFYGVNRSNIEHYKEKKLPGRPKHEAYGRIDISKTFKKWGAGTWFDADYAGKAYAGQYNSETFVTLHYFLGTGIHAELPTTGLTLTFEVKNLLNALVFKNNEGNWLPMSDYNRYPLPGRTFLGTVHWQRR